MLSAILSIEGGNDFEEEPSLVLTAIEDYVSILSSPTPPAPQSFDEIISALNSTQFNYAAASAYLSRAEVRMRLIVGCYCQLVKVA